MYTVSKIAKEAGLNIKAEIKSNIVIKSIFSYLIIRVITKVEIK